MRFGRTGPSLGAIILLAIAVAALLGFDLPELGSDSSGGEGIRGGEAEAEVLRVIDGDTIEVELAGEEEDVRYIGIDTPESAIPGEPVECYGKEAAAANEDLVGGETVRLVFDAERRDHYGRLLAYVYADDTFVNARLVADGYATTLEIEPNTSRAGRLGELETAAGREGAGLWAAC